MPASGLQRKPEVLPVFSIAVGEIVAEARAAALVERRRLDAERHARRVRRRS
ncbi:hypothetical protein FGG44_gp40 [Mycobacterium phage MacnCheese]|uniref:Uncharacterized protein n=1 Tax=Mycobacterium phage MacnCheese TaxID=2927982 RepID=I6XHS5_9CAUD|nr:hypothetical protein FGG44_gp40 [Mycobacterium phage MacnCheese]AFN37734.1 hypothetical protein MACNCHEESE_40 [Mycobacterium phage MacnCheese]